MRVGNEGPVVRLPDAEGFRPSRRTLTICFAASSPIPRQAIPSTELAALEPALKPGMAGGYLYESDAHLRPDRLMKQNCGESCQGSVWTFGKTAVAASRGLLARPWLPRAVHAGVPGRPFR